MPKAQRSFCSNRTKGDVESLDQGKLAICTDYRWKDFFFVKIVGSTYYSEVFFFGFEKSKSDRKRSSRHESKLQQD